MTSSHRKARLMVAGAGILACAIGLIGTSAGLARKPVKDDGRVAVGDPVDCITPSHIRATRVLDDQTIDFETDRREVYRNRLPYSCPSLGFEKRFSYRLSTSQLCSVDIITVLGSGGPGLTPGASCGLGKFQKMSKPAK